MGRDTLTPSGYRALTAHMAGVPQQATVSLQSGKSENPSACFRIFQCTEATYPTRPPSREQEEERGMASSPSLQTRIPAYTAFWGNYLPNLQLRDWGITRHGCEDVQVSGLRRGQCLGRTSRRRMSAPSWAYLEQAILHPTPKPCTSQLPLHPCSVEGCLDPTATDSTLSLPPPNKKGEMVCLIGAEQSSNLTTEGVTAPCLQGPSVAGCSLAVRCLRFTVGTASSAEDARALPSGRACCPAVPLAS